MSRFSLAIAKGRMSSPELTSVEMIPSERMAMVSARLRGAFFCKGAIEAGRKGEFEKKRGSWEREEIVRGDTESIQNARLHEDELWRVMEVGEQPRIRVQASISRSGQFAGCIHRFLSCCASATREVVLERVKCCSNLSDERGRSP